MKINRKITSQIVKYIIVITLSIVTLLPYLWMVTTSLKPFADVFLFPPKWIPDPLRLENYVELFEQAPYELYLWNSFKVSAMTTIFVLVLSILSAYAFAKIRFPGHNLVFIIFLSAMMIPIEVIIVPLYLGMAKAGLANTHLSVVLPHVFGGATVFGIFMMRQSFITIPDEIIEASKIDGCSPNRTLLQIVVPMSTSSISALVIYTFFHAWNDYFTPLIMLSNYKTYTVPIALTMFTLEAGTQWNLVMAAATVATLPLLLIFFIFQRKIVESLATTGIK